MSTSASSLNWWYMPGSVRLMKSGGPARGDVEERAAVRRAATRLHLGPDRAGHHVARQELRRAARVLVAVEPARRLLHGSRRLGRELLRDVVEHEALAVLLLSRMPPSPRTPSVTRMPRTLSGQTMPVG